MWNIEKQIESAAQSLNITVKKLSKEQQQKIITKVKSKFTTPKTGWPLWGHLIDAYSKQDANAWKSLKKFIGESKSILFFNPSDEEGAFLIKNGNDLVSILGETFNVEFYVTNENEDYLFCFNHHDVLLASGNAKTWLEDQ